MNKTIETIQLKTKDIPELREKILQEQNGICLICKKQIQEGEVVLDHAHKKKLKLSGQIRGTLDRTCNVFLGKIENSCARFKINIQELPVILRNCADYLEKEEYPFLHPTEKKPDLILKKSSYNKVKKKLKEINYKFKIPEYKINKKKKPTQKLTKIIDKLYKKVNLEPEFY